MGVTLSRPQAELARKRAAERGLGDRVEVRFADYRDVDDGPYDAISSIGMFEHVGLSELDAYFTRCRGLLRPQGRLLNHGISRPQHAGKMHHHRWAPGRLDRNFIERYVFPDGELHEIGNVVSAIQRAGFEARHMESLREHYALTLRCWVRNLEDHWDDAVAEVGPGRGACLAALHGGGRGGLRARRQPGAPGARHRDDRRRQRHAPPAPVHLTSPAFARTPGALMSGA